MTLASLPRPINATPSRQKSPCGDDAGIRTTPDLHRDTIDLQLDHAIGTRLSGHHGRLADPDFGKCGLRPGWHSAQCTRHRLAPSGVDRAAADLVKLDRRPDRPIRPKRIPQDRQLLLNGSPAPTGYPPDNLDPTTHTTGRMTTRYICSWFDSLV
jgi:hypothetical protein